MALITFFYFKLIHVNHATVGFTFLLAVLVVAAWWGLRAAIATAVLATLTYNFFFLPPVLKLTIADPQNWVALIVFLITASIASQLAERARREARQADARRREVERLYQFSQRLLISENVFGLLNAVPQYLVEAFGVSGAAVFLDNKGKVYYSDASIQMVIPADQLRMISGLGEPSIDRKQRRCFCPRPVGVRTVGSVGLDGCDLSLETLVAIGSLVAIALERAGAVEELTKAEAARESERLRTLLLDSVTHEFRTPLTAIKASAEALLGGKGLEESQRTELLTVINEESDHLNRLVGEAAEVAQLDSHQIELHMEPHQMREAIDHALEQSRPALQHHTVDVFIPENVPPVRMDVGRIAQALSQLLENAGKYSPPETTIHISVEQKGGQLITSVADHGAGIDDMEQSMIFEKFYRGQNQRVSVQGTGMGLAIAKAILQLHGGTIGVTSQLDHGSVFSISLPVT